MAPTSTTVSTTLTPNSANKEKSSLTAENAENAENPKRRRPKQYVAVDNFDSFLERALRHPMQDRKSLSEKYVVPVTDREGWWRKEIRETPIPGSYNSGSFLEEIEKRPNTYRFKSDGRKIDPHPYNKGSLLLPGAYQHHDFLDRLEKADTTYSFKATQRNARDFMNLGRKDKDVNVCPTAYGVEKHMTLTVDKQPSRHWYFRSQTNRFPSASFKPREGPGPGSYSSNGERASWHGITSSFKSRTPRFRTSHTRVPGPGAYEKTYQMPMPGTIAKMGRQNGLFFSSAFEA